MKNLMKYLKLVLYQKRVKAAMSFCPFENNLYTPGFFKQRLFFEKRRAERLKTKSSILIFDLTQSQNNRTKILKDQKQKDIFNKIDQEYLIKSIGSTIRATDAVSLYKENIILILLADTDYDGACCVCQRLKLYLKEICQHYFKIKGLNSDDIEIRILSYPEKAREYNFSKERIIYQKEKNYESQREGTLPVNPLINDSFKEEYLEPLNLHIGTFNGSSIALPVGDIFLWDHELISNFRFWLQTGVKRLMDIIGSIICLILFSPMMIVTAFLVKLTSPGPIIFKQTRTGYRGKYFTFLKFRSMYINNNCDDHQKYVVKLINGDISDTNMGSQNKPVYKIKDDPRITPVGKFIRMTSIDELPQFWNVLKGEMSLVGPRPAIPYEVKEYKYWHQRRILGVKPGITGLWQVSGRNRTTFDEMVRLDILYARNFSLWLDLKILLKTFKVIFMPDGE